MTDGRYTYFRYPENMEQQDLWEYTLMPMRQKGMFTGPEFDDADLVRPFNFLRGYPVMRLPFGRSPFKGQGSKIEDAETALYDLANDPGQTNPIDDPETEARLVEEMSRIMRQNEAPVEAYLRLGLTAPNSAQENT